MKGNFGITIIVDIKEVQFKLASLGRDLNKNHILGMIGAGLLKWINDNFRAEGLEKKWKPLSPNTVFHRRKKSNAILQDRGDLRKSFIDAYGADWVSVGSPGDLGKIALWHHLGTKPYDIFPRNKRAIGFKAPWSTVVKGPWKNYVAYKKIHHPGLPSRQLLPSTGVARELVMRNVNAYIGAVLKKHA